jgi:tetratricopeptide (TPR) repeat protein
VFAIGAEESWTTRVTRRIDDVGAVAASVAQLAAWILLAGVATYLIAGRLAQWARARQRPQFVVKEVIGDDETLSVRAPSLAAEMEARLVALGTSHSEVERIDVRRLTDPIVVPPSVALALPQATATLAQVFLDLVRVVVPPREFDLSAHLLPASDAGVGLSLAIVGLQGGVNEAITLRADRFGAGIVADGNSIPPDASQGDGYDVLLNPAAIWIVHQLPRKGAGVYPKRQWLAIALLAEGLRQQELGAFHHALSLFGRAAESWDDRTFLEAGDRRIALDLNRGITYVRAGCDPPTLTLINAGISCLRTAQARCDDVASDWYLAQYHITIAYASLAMLSTSARKAEHWKKALTSAQRLLKDAELKEPTLSFVSRHESLFLVLLAGVLQRFHRRGSSQCTPLVNLDDLRTLLRKSEVNADGAALATVDPNAIIGLVTQHLDVDYRVRYNLACYYSESRQYDKAVDFLNGALYEAGPDLSSWAHRDPALAQLRAERPNAFQ